MTQEMTCPQCHTRFPVFVVPRDAFDGSAEALSETITRSLDAAKRCANHNPTDCIRHIEAAVKAHEALKGWGSG